MIPVTRYFFSTAEALADGSPGKIFLLYRIIPAREFYVPGNDDTEIRTVTSEEDMDDDNEMAVGDPFFQVEGCTAEGWDKAEVVLACEVAEENAANTLRKMGAVEISADGKMDSDTAQFARLINSIAHVGGLDQGGGLLSDVEDDLGVNRSQILALVQRAAAATERYRIAKNLIPEIKA